MFTILSTWGQKVKVDHSIQVLRNLYIKIQHLFANILQSLIGMFMSIMELLYFRYEGKDTLFTTTMYDWLTPCVICSWHLMTDERLLWYPRWGGGVANNLCNSKTLHFFDKGIWLNKAAYNNNVWTSCK
jgi:hypothetical protein